MFENFEQMKAYVTENSTIFTPDDIEYFERHCTQEFELFNDLFEQPKIEKVCSPESMVEFFVQTGKRRECYRFDSYEDYWDYCDDRKLYPDDPADYYVLEDNELSGVFMLSTI